MREWPGRATASPAFNVPYMNASLPSDGRLRLVVTAAVFACWGPAAGAGVCMRREPAARCNGT